MHLGSDKKCYYLNFAEHLKGYLKMVGHSFTRESYHKKYLHMLRNSEVGSVKKTLKNILAVGLNQYHQITGDMMYGNVLQIARALLHL